MYKKLISCLITAALILSLSACAEKPDKEKPKEENENISAIEDDNVLETEEDTDEDVTEQQTEDVEVVLSSEEQYKINIFISNFAEQYVKEYDSDNVDDYWLIYFAYIHAGINNNDQITYDELDGKTYAAITLEEVNRVLEKYLDKKVTPEEGQIYYDDILFKNGKFNFEPATGESYPEIAVVNKMTKLSDGTYKVKFKIYSIFEYSVGGNIVDDKNFYYMTEEQAANSTEMEETGEGEALVEYKDGLYKLLKYQEY